ncbi:MULTISPECIES: SDR family oxidoreductase [Cytobacillus]|jgi:dTDP-4-dehydrorhamnose reductase|uniref:dTDP-4-dehydrorhamnose reductase n=1 Tax=Cytobacillus oceanisediminis 2691 TaxID=1196031 RepID=A0A160MB30_9BACI|nr:MULTISPECIES: SDR family oxidoreductase [Cytobacillus]EFV75931.1 LPS biosynthesis like reductase [Bacillus sp. 2_A_57_CT2]AND39794.1 NAD(P)-dependent oxidoreductase [Cytobacillus oceanisediminis 2691]MBU8728935.1 SDR family oxidoreductase [Cytobacillus oceanisediminis]MCM3244926.1 SDR family oxidoreductase [Cytobacillus oceanisediminis]MCM3394414.1 SDR family oxidoreductase [Cytobacillus oceanisediminis]
MKVLVLGGKGMAGHMIVDYLQRQPQYNVIYTSRNKEDEDGIYLDITDSLKLEDVINKQKPDVIINCIGILNEFAEKNQKLAFQVNSLLPHQLVKFAERYNGKVIHISTDCVFLGTKGNYSENDIPDGTSVYAESKQLGEIISDTHLTIRTSIIGPELKGSGIGLFLWFMKQKGNIKGYKEVYWNGVTTLELAKAIDWMIKQNITGLYHLSCDEKISKYNLLMLIKEIFNKRDVVIQPDSEIKQDRTIINTRSDWKYQVPPYKEMLLELRDWMKKK